MFVVGRHDFSRHSSSERCTSPVERWPPRCPLPFLLRQLLRSLQLLLPLLPGNPSEPLLVLSRLFCLPPRTAWVHAVSAHRHAVNAMGASCSGRSTTVGCAVVQVKTHGSGIANSRLPFVSAPLWSTPPPPIPSPPSYPQLPLSHPAPVIYTHGDHRSLFAPVRLCTIGRVSRSESRRSWSSSRTKGTGATRRR